jgi:hypothetical protein
MTICMDEDAVIPRNDLSTTGRLTDYLESAYTVIEVTRRGSDRNTTILRHFMILYDTIIDSDCNYLLSGQ